MIRPNRLFNKNCTIIIQAKYSIIRLYINDDCIKELLDYGSDSLEIEDVPDTIIIQGIELLINRYQDCYFTSYDKRRSFVENSPDQRPSALYFSFYIGLSFMLWINVIFLVVIDDN